MAPTRDVLEYNRRVVKELMDLELKRRAQGAKGIEIARKTIVDGFHYLEGRPDMPVQDQIQKLQHIHGHYTKKAGGE